MVVSQTGTAEPVLASNVDINTSLASATIPAAGITGTLGSGVTFPAGHVIQTVHKIDVTSGEINRTSSGSDSPTASGIKNSISCTSGNIVKIEINVYTLQNTPTHQLKFAIYKAGTRLQHSTTEIPIYQNTQTYQVVDRLHIMAIDASAPTSLTEYELYFWVANTSNYGRISANNSYPCYIILTEIQQ